MHSVLCKDKKVVIIIDFLEKSSTINSTSYYQHIRQNSPYLLNDPCMCVHIYIYIYIYTHTHKQGSHTHTHTYIYILWGQIKIKRSPDEQQFKSVWELVHLNIVITKQGVYFFCKCEDGAVWHLIPCRISPCSESFLGNIGTGILCGG